MSKSDTFENDLLLLLFNNTNIANVGDATGVRGSTDAGSLYLALHTADPGEAGNQTTSECNYTSYARVAVARSGSGFTVTGNSVVLAANADFANPTNATNLPQTATHFSIGAASTSTGKVLYKGAITPNIVIANTGVTPRLTTGTTVTED
jgi:predicted methyltransferase